MSKSFKKNQPKPATDSKVSIIDRFVQDKPEDTKQEPTVKQTVSTPKPKIKSTKKTKPERKYHGANIRMDIVEKLKDFVWTKKITGEPYYQQGQAIEEGLEMLFKTIKIQKRPSDID